MRFSHTSHRPRGREHPLATTDWARRQGGYVLTQFALLLVPLLLMAGLAIDIGYWYSRVSEIQKAADAAALAGVVWLPNEDLAEDYALEAAKRNGYDNSVSGISVTVTKTGERRLRVTIEDRNVGSFLFEALGGKSPDLTRTAHAEYILPVKMGSPLNSLGNDPTATGYPTGAPNLWASISGPQADYVNGDPFSTKQNGNPEYRNWGYLYVVDIEEAHVNKDITLWVYDAGNYPRSDYPNVETADNGTVNTSFELFRPDTTPLDSLDGLTSTFSMSGKCSSGPGRWRLAHNVNATTHRNKWAALCTFRPTTPGLWILQVKSSNIPTITDSGSGWNQFSLRALASSTPNPALYTLGDLSMFNNLPGQSGNINANFYLAEIEPIHAGKTLEVSLFDPGDGQSGDYFANIKGPGNSTLSCRYKERTSTSWTQSSNCRIQTRANGTNVYNGKWLDIQIAVGNSYTCTDCWWKVLYEFRNVSVGASPNDRTVWSARLIGDPVHLVEEEAE